MIAIIRVRFPNTPPAQVWSDAIINNWMNPGIQYSLAHFWTRTSFFQADMRYFLFPAITMADPRPKTPADTQPRDYLVDEVIKEGTRLFKPDWNVFDRLLILFAQGTDQFGGGGYKVGDGGKLIPVAVVDISSPFSNMCQEVGHTFLLDHEIDGAGEEYTSPYSCMSSESYGGADSSFERRIDQSLPVGTAPLSDKVTHVKTNDVQRVVGPYITPVHLYIKKMGVFIDDKTVYHVPESYATAPHSFKLTALDVAIDKWPSRQLVLAVVPPVVANGDTYFFELRRKASYDAGLTLDGSNLAPVALVVHATNLSTGKVRYVNRVALVASPGDHDYHCFAGHFTVRLNSFAEDFSNCSITVGGNDFWKYFGVNFDTFIPGKRLNDESDWSFAKVSPCFMFPTSVYTYRYKYFVSEVVIVASSFGYEQPNYQWFLNDLPLDPTKSQITIKSKVKLPHNGVLGEPVDSNVNVHFTIKSNSLNVTFNQLFSGIYITIKVVVNESSPEVLQNLYPDRTVWTGTTINNVETEWDEQYNNAQKACAKRIKQISDHYAISKTPLVRNPEPDWGISVINLINELVVSNPTAANAAINEVAKMGNINKLQVIKKLR